jgi:hypothetical protein
MATSGNVAAGGVLGGVGSISCSCNPEHTAVRWRDILANTQQSTRAVLESFSILALQRVLDPRPLFGREAVTVTTD